MDLKASKLLMIFFQKLIGHESGKSLPNNKVPILN
jgi:hypothetical protein